MFDEQDPSSVIPPSAAGPAHQNTRKIRNYLIRARFQLQQLAWVAIFMAAMAVTYGASFFLILQSLVPPEIRDAYLPTRILMIPMVVTTVLFILVGAAFSIIISHKVAGPMYRFKLIMGKIRNGDLEARVNLRPEDEFADVAEDFNTLMDQLLGKKKS